MIDRLISINLLGPVVVLVLRFLHTEAEQTCEQLRVGLLFLATTGRANGSSCKALLAYDPAQVQRTWGPAGAIVEWVDGPGCKGRIPVDAASPKGGAS